MQRAHAQVRVATLALGEAEKKEQRETGNNQRADSADEWDSGSEDIVRSIDGIGVCNVN